MGAASAKPRCEETHLAPTERAKQHSRARVLRNMLVFQAKLFVDGLKDIILAPVAFVTVVVGMLTDRDNPGRLFYMLMRVGRRFDDWMNLFGADEPASSDVAPTPRSKGDLDGYLTRLEAAVRGRYDKNGELTNRARHAIDRAIDLLENRSSTPTDGDDKRSR